MELETQLNASDRNTRAIIGNNFQKIQEDTNTRLDQLEQEKATHDEVNNLRTELLKKINRIILGTDEETVKTVIQEMKKEGMI